MAGKVDDGIEADDGAGCVREGEEGHDGAGGEMVEQVGLNVDDVGAGGKAVDVKAGH